MNIQNRDFNLLYVFKVVYEELNTTLAAKRLAISQPALSHKLNKLRREYNDDLFVRAPRGLTATPRAQELAPVIFKLVSDIEDFYQGRDNVDFNQAIDTISIYTTDYIEQVLLPELLATLESTAPNVRLVIKNTLGQLPRQALETGECDIAIAGFYTDLPPTFYRQALRKENFLVLSRKDNPLIHNDMDLADFLRCRHLVTTLTGDLQGLVDNALEKKGYKRKIIAGTSSFIVPPQLVAQSDYIVTCLSNIANEAVKNDPRLVAYACPISLDAIGIEQYSHQRTQGHPIRRWIRQQIHRILSIN